MLRWLVRFFQFFVLAALFIGLPLTIYLLDLPDVKPLQTQNPKTTALIELRENQAEAANQKIKTKMMWRPFHSISPNLVHAILLSEDDMFYRHHGIDVEQVRAAAKLNWRKKRFVYGGSTITQQLARTLYLSPKKNLLRKAKEALITIELERNLSKKRILEVYLNVVEWGQGIYGAEAASQHYFHKPASDLTPDEAVALTSILPSPRRWSPFGERGFMARRRSQIYRRMERAGYIPVEVSSDTATIPELDGLIEIPLKLEPLDSEDILDNDSH